MPMYLARWPDGSFSLVHADNEQEAYVRLDELGVEPAELRVMESCLLDFELTDRGTFRLCQFGDDTLDEILDAYPSLDARSGPDSLTNTTYWMIREASPAMTTPRKRFSPMRCGLRENDSSPLSRRAPRRNSESLFKGLSAVPAILWMPLWR